MEYTIRLTEQDFLILSAALVELPYKVAAPLIDRLNQQLAAQHEKPVLSEERKQKPAE